MKILWPKWDRIINVAFIPLIADMARYIICIGGRGSGKSDAMAKKLIYRCLHDKYFRYLLVRRNYNTIKNSQWQNLKDLITEMGLAGLFHFTQQPLEITCVKNGNKFIGVGCDDTTKLKSVKDPTGAWYEEDIIDEKDFITITTSIRTLKAHLQEIFTVNPEVKGDYRKNWFYKRFFEKYKGKKRYSDRTTITYTDGDDGIEKTADLTFTVHHSTYKDNRWLPGVFKAFLENMKGSNPYYYTIYTLGNWGNKITGGLAYKSFSQDKHIKKLKYDPKKAIHVSFDFNVRPYLTMLLFQIEGDEFAAKRKVYLFDAILAEDPHNNTAGACKLFKHKYPRHTAGLRIYGDPAGKHEDTRGEKGHNDFYIIMNELRDYNPTKHIANAAPAVVARIGWMNKLFHDMDPIEFYIDEDLGACIMDFTEGKEDLDGTKLKEKEKDPITELTSEKYHHVTDATDYFMCEVFRASYNSYLRGHRKTESTAGQGSGFNHSEH